MNGDVVALGRHDETIDSNKELRYSWHARVSLPSSSSPAAPLAPTPDSQVSPHNSHAPSPNISPSSATRNSRPTSAPPLPTTRRKTSSFSPEGMPMVPSAAVSSVAGATPPRAAPNSTLSRASAPAPSSPPSPSSAKNRMMPPCARFTPPFETKMSSTARSISHRPTPSSTPPRSSASSPSM